MTPSDHDTADLRKDIRELREQMIRVEEGQKHGHAQLDRLNQSLGKHEAEDKASFDEHARVLARHDQQLARFQDIFSAGRFTGKFIMGGVTMILGVVIWVLVEMLKAKGIGP